MFCNFQCISLALLSLTLFWSISFFCAIVSKIIFQISFWDCSLPVCKNTIDFCIFILYPATLFDYYCKQIFCEFLRIFYIQYHVTVNIDNFTYLYLDAFRFFFFFLESPIHCWTEVRRVDILVPDLREKTFNLLLPNATLCALRTVAVCGLLGTGLHSRSWAADMRVKLHLYLQPLPIACITTWAPPPVRSAAALDSHRSANPTVNCACEGSRLRTPYQNLMPDDLRWSWGSDASTGEWLQIQIIISREVWLHRDHNKSVASRRIKTLSVSGKWKEAQGSHWFCIMVRCIIISLYIIM